ncbi:hypothetical protein UlMin_027891 [Ulmus minor]
MEESTVVVIVGAGPSGLATSDCSASLWRKRSYDRLGLHLAKSFCSLPLKPHSPETPIFMSKETFIAYIDSYVSELDIMPKYYHCIELSFFYEERNKWVVEAKNLVSGDMEKYYAQFLVVAIGENNEAFFAKLPGLESFGGETLHSSEYKCGEAYCGKDVLVVGCGNYGMEICNDLTDYEAWPTMVVRSPPLYKTNCILSGRMVESGMLMLKWLPMSFVDFFISLAAKFTYGDLSKYGIIRPRKDPFSLKVDSERTPVIDGGSIEKIKSKKIKVVPAILNIRGNQVLFANGTEGYFDVIIFATGYRSVAHKWLKDYCYLLNDNGMPRNEYPNHWKGENGIYCAGLTRGGLPGLSSDVIVITNDICKILLKNK